MFQSKLEKFILKRVLMLVPVAMAVGVLITDHWAYVLGGLLAGAVYGVLRFSSIAKSFFAINFDEKPSLIKRNVLKYVFSQTVVVILLFIFLEFDIVFFAGAVAGLLLVPFAIMINSITEVLGISNNNFE